jgi:hypothetical protein
MNIFNMQNILHVSSVRRYLINTIFKRAAYLPKLELLFHELTTRNGFRNRTVKFYFNIGYKKWFLTNRAFLFLWLDGFLHSHQVLFPKMGIHPDVLRERDAGFTWWRPAGTGIKIDRSTITKTRDSPEFAVGLGAMEFRNGLHEFEFFVTRNSEGYVYVGVAHPDIPTDKTFCRRDAKDQVYISYSTTFPEYFMK